MRSRSVDTITSNDQYVRLKIFDGLIPLGEAGAELLRLALLDHDQHDGGYRVLAMRLGHMESALLEHLRPTRGTISERGHRAIDANPRKVK